MSSTKPIQPNQQTAQDVPNQHLNGAAVIDPQGHEIPITEEMILEALNAMESESFQRAYADQHLYLPV